MGELRRAPTAEERLAQLERDRARLNRERLLREVAGPRWRRMVRVIPLLFERQGVLEARRLLADRDTVTAALRDDAVFALDTALRLARGHGFLAGGDVHAYVRERAAIERLAALGLVANQPHADAVLVRPWPGPPRLLACLVDVLPPSRTLPSGHRVVEADRLVRELIGAVGPRADLYALAE